MQKDLASLEEKKIQVIGLSYDAVDVLKTFSDRERITFSLLSDPDSATIKAFDLLNPDGKGVPWPGTMILDKDRTIRAKTFLDGYRQRHPPEEILKAVSELK